MSLFHKVFNLYTRILIRIFNILFPLFILYLIFFNVLPFFTNKTGWLWGVLIVYILSAYLIFPFSIRFNVLLIGKKHIPRYALTPDGLPLDPVNLILVGDYSKLSRAFLKSGWYIADQNNPKNLVKHIVCFIVNKPYKTAPFSSLYLFGRKQDIGFQKQTGRGPRYRHHVRFWGIDENIFTKLSTKDIWHIAHAPDLERASVWLGAATEDTGLGYRKDTFQITHATNNDTDCERDYIVSSLKKAGFVQSIENYHSGQLLTGIPKPINHFVSDGNITIVFLK